MVCVDDCLLWCFIEYMRFICVEGYVVEVKLIVCCIFDGDVEDFVGVVC